MVYISRKVRQEERGAKKIKIANGLRTINQLSYNTTI